MNTSSTTNATAPSKTAKPRKIVTADEALSIAKATIATLKAEKLDLNRQLADLVVENAEAVRLMTEAEDAVVAVCTLIRVDPTTLGSAADVLAAVQAAFDQYSKKLNAQVTQLTDENAELCRYLEAKQEDYDTLLAEKDQIAEEFKQYQDNHTAKASISTSSKLKSKFGGGSVGKHV